MSSAIRVLTGITTSGTPHLGNYVGAIRPSVQASLSDGVESFYFLADYHALIKVGDPLRVQRSTLEIAASWMACGLDPDRVWFYRQSDIPETPELTWLLTCVAGKGLLNRAHAYKAAVDRNVEAGADPDAGVTAGLFMYPVLMAADILLFNANRVPVGRDQVQHIEMARDFGARFNHLYGDEFFVLPEAAIEEHVATLPGTDGRKMSKSYDNTIPLFGSAAELKKAIYGIVTDSKMPGEAKDADSSNVFALYRAFASEQQTAALRKSLVDGMAWGDAKQALLELLDGELAPLRERYTKLMAKPEDIEAILQRGAAKARLIATPLLARLRHAVGLRSLSVGAGQEADKAAPQVGSKPPVFKQYRDADGLFYFKLVAHDGRLLLQSLSHASPKEAGQRIATLKRDGAAAISHAVGEGVKIADTVIGHLAEDVALDELVDALAMFAEEGG